MIKMPRINASIVNWKTRDDIDRCLSSLYSDAKADGLEILVHVVDNSGNADGIKEMLKEKYPEAAYMDSGGNIGFGRAQNLGLSSAVADYYITLNADIELIPQSRTLNRLVDYMKRHAEAGLIGPQLVNPDGSSQSSCRRFPRLFQPIANRLGLKSFMPGYVGDYLMEDYKRDKTVPVDWIIGGFMMINSEVAENVGFFDERFFLYFEDCDLCRRIWQSGREVHYVHDVKVKHLHRRQSADMDPALAVLKNPVARMHIKSWYKYFRKWGVKRPRYGY